MDPSRRSAIAKYLDSRRSYTRNCDLSRDEAKASASVVKPLFGAESGEGGRKPKKDKDSDAPGDMKKRDDRREDDERLARDVLALVRGGELSRAVARADAAELAEAVASTVEALASLHPPDDHLLPQSKFPNFGLADPRTFGRAPPEVTAAAYNAP